ncbi:Similar to Sterol uptake control protein 2; acc. no. Q12151 [Pyronema omphalodes CBS 100304]|uniref:Similar to Sterol uptake control protein 2 acc. no. Q12151 n=1 Tax=Pyronema omphalodes (strain CBS 100304) TaxID=1076935 RepID=U4L1H9_PYROM|nr:Similar to Sterol uptake control protein 2; acc. no. Q12151 [Pyronema omphalodes CBS 100304]
MPKTSKNKQTGEQIGEQIGKPELKKRSKLGCRQCCTRKVKCDEVRPACGQCSKYKKGAQASECDWTPRLQGSKTRPVTISRRRDNPSNLCPRSNSTPPGGSRLKGNLSQSLRSTSVPIGSSHFQSLASKSTTSLPSHHSSGPLLNGIPFPSLYNLQAIRRRQTSPELQTLHENELLYHATKTLNSNLETAYNDLFQQITAEEEQTRALYWSVLEDCWKLEFQSPLSRELMWNWPWDLEVKRMRQALDIAYSHLKETLQKEAVLQEEIQEQVVREQVVREQVVQEQVSQEEELIGFKLDNAAWQELLEQSALGMDGVLSSFEGYDEFSWDSESL